MRSLAAWPSFWRMFIDVDLCGILKLLPITAIYSHLFPSILPTSDFPSPTAQVPSPIPPTSSKFPGRPSASTSAASGPAEPPGRLGRPGPPPSAADPCPALGRSSAGSRRAATYHKDGKWMESGWKVHGNCMETGKYHNCDSRLLLGGCSGSESAI